MSTILASLITLVGTLGVGAIGFWQWRRTQSETLRKEYRAKRIETLRILWESLNEIEERQRSELIMDTSDPTPLQQEQLRRANMLLMKSAPFLRDDEREWSAVIVQSIMEIDTAVRLQKNMGHPGIEWWITSAIEPPSANVASIAAYNLDVARTALGGRYAQVVHGEHD